MMDFTDPAFYRQRNDGGPCPSCKAPLVVDVPDPCLGKLPGVLAACCGHGDRSAAYILFGDGTIVREFTIETSEYADIVRIAYARTQAER